MHVVINGKDFFPFYGYIIFHGGVCVCVWCVYPIFFSHSFFDRHLSYFHVLSTINNGVVNMGVHITFQVFVFVSFGQLPSFLKNMHSVFYDGCTKFHYHQQCKKVVFFFFPIYLPKLLCCPFNSSHSNKCEVISHCDSDFHFPDN